MITRDGKKLDIFDDGIQINYELPKWKNAKRVSPKKVKSDTSYIIQNPGAGTTTSGFNTGMPTIIVNGNFDGEVDANNVTPWDAEAGEGLKKVNFEDAAKMKIKDLTAFINEYGVAKIYGGQYASWGNSTFRTELTYSNEADNPKHEPEKKGLFAKLFKKKEEKKPAELYEISVLDFFENVKLLSKTSEGTYKDRVEKYLSALATATMTGQVALKEKLAREMFVNKYEAELYANGMYYVVTEEQAAQFARKTEKGVSLIYLKNFARPLPDKVVKKLEEANSLEVFDNYVILTYDPEKKDAIETEEERAKRKDPILFGVIAGSHKLYYIADWIDDYCDLTLQELVDKLDIKKSDLKMK